MVLCEDLRHIEKAGDARKEPSDGPKAPIKLTDR